MALYSERLLKQEENKLEIPSGTIRLRLPLGEKLGTSHFKALLTKQLEDKISLAPQQFVEGNFIITEAKEDTLLGNFVPDATITNDELVPERIDYEVQETGFSEEDAILGDLETTGAGQSTTIQDGAAYTDTGVAASNRMAQADLASLEQYASIFIEVGKAKGVPPALLAAISSRESRGGSALDSEGKGDAGHGFGLMQIDDRSHKAKGAYNSKEHIEQATDIFLAGKEKIDAKFPEWTDAQRLRAAVAAYNFGVDDVQTWEGLDKGTTGDDYSADTWARARYYAGLKLFSGHDPVPDAVVPQKDDVVKVRPLVPKGLLIAESVGLGGTNHPDDVKAVLAKLEELHVITHEEATDSSPEAVEAYVFRYQNMIFNSGADGVIQPGKTTEKKLIDGITTKPKPVVVKQKSAPKRTPVQVPSDPKQAAKSPEPDYVHIAEVVHSAMFDGLLWGVGTDRKSIIKALKELKQDATYIDKFKKVYRAIWKSDVVKDIDSEVDNWFLIVRTGELDEIMVWLTPATGKQLKGNGDKIDQWIGHKLVATTVGEKNKEYAQLILDAVDLGFAVFNNEGEGKKWYQAGMGGVEDTFHRIVEGKAIGNGTPDKKGGKAYFYPDKEEISALRLLHHILLSKVTEWDQAGRNGNASAIMIGSFMIWNSDKGGGILRDSNHGAAGRAIDFNFDKNQDGTGDPFTDAGAVPFVIDILKRLDVGTYEIGLPRQGQFMDIALVTANHTSKAADGSWAYTKIKSKELKAQIETMLENGCVLKVISDNDNHLHLAYGGGGSSSYMDKNVLK